MKTTTLLYAMHRETVHSHATALRTAWANVPNVEERLRYENRVGADTCMWIIHALRTLQTTAQQAESFVEHHPQMASPTTRVMLTSLVHELDEAIMWLVVVREHCRADISVAMLRERRHALTHMRLMQTTLDRALMALDEDGKEEADAIQP